MNLKNVVEGKTTEGPNKNPKRGCNLKKSNPIHQITDSLNSCTQTKRVCRFLTLLFGVWNRALTVYSDARFKTYICIYNELLQCTQGKFVRVHECATSVRAGLWTV